MSGVALAADAARVELAPAVGGSIASFRWRGQDVLRATDDEARSAGNVSGFACYPLVPWSNRIANATFVLRDGSRIGLARNFGDHPHAIHGVGWQRAWHVVDATEAQATLALDHPPDASWPFAFQTAQSFVLRADAHTVVLTCTLRIRNDDARGFPFGLGWHPFFPRDAQTQLEFRAATIWETDSTCLPTRKVPVAGRWQFHPLRPLADTTLDNVFAGWDGQATLQWPNEGRRVTIEADRACAHLVVYAPAQRNFVAVEPATHMTDAFNREARGEPGTGTRWLEPGESRSCTMRIVASLDS